MRNDNGTEAQFKKISLLIISSLKMEFLKSDDDKTQKSKNIFFF